MTIYSYKDVEWSDRYQDLVKAFTIFYIAVIQDGAIDYWDTDLDPLYALVKDSNDLNYSLEIKYLKHEIGLAEHFTEKQFINFFKKLKLKQSGFQ